MNAMLNAELFHGGIAVFILGMAVGIYRKLSRLVAALEDFPPHRHVNGHILYPKGYAPEVERSLGIETAH